MCLKAEFRMFSYPVLINKTLNLISDKNKLIQFDQYLLSSMPQFQCQFMSVKA